MLFLLKLIVAVTVVMVLSTIAERVSTKTAGILSGFPTGTAITLFFIGLEVGPKFAANSAEFNMIGLIAMQSLIFLYYITSKKYGIILSSLISISGYLAVIWSLHLVDFSRFMAVILPLISVFVFMALFKPISNVQIEKRIPLSRNVLMFRALLAASTIILITSLASSIGSTWSGLLTAFPTTLFPLILIVHFTHKTDHVHTIIKNVPVGIPSLILFSLSVSLTYPIFGIYLGTVMSFAVATAYVVIYGMVSRNRLKLSNVNNSIDLAG